MSPLTGPLATFRDKLVQSRFLTLSLTLHAILLALIGMVVVTQAPPPEPGSIQSEKLVDAKPDTPERPHDTTPTVKYEDLAKTQTPPSQMPISTPIDIIRGGVNDFKMPEMGSTLSKVPTPNIPQVPETKLRDGELTKPELARIRDFVKDWKVGNSSSQPAYAFTAYLGQYRGGNWNSTVRISAQGQITGGSLPNLLYCTSKWSKDRIQTNERNVKAIALDSPELLNTKPPFVFLTGTRDFRLTDAEVENLRNYIRCGGAVWGDSSVPGRRSAFDIAFRREMKRVLADRDKQFEPLPADHPIFSQGYYKKLTSLPAGINNYSEPVEVLRYGGEVAVIHTLNDYGDMWQIGLDKNGRIDLSKNAQGEYVAMNPVLWSEREIYLRNIDQASVEQAYQFGINMIMHLLTRWENRTASVGSL